MAATGKPVPKDANSIPVASAYNAARDEHEPVQGSGGAPRVRIADGDHVAFGARDDAATDGDDLSGSFTLIQLAKERLNLLRARLA